MSRPLTDREALTPVAVLLAELILLAATGTLLLGGWRTLAGVVALASLPLAVFGVWVTWRVFFRMLPAMAEVRRQRAEAEAGSAGVPVDGRDQPT